MKKMIALLISVLMMTMMMSGALAETKIAVSGNGSTLISADTAVVTLGIRARNAEVLAAQEKANSVIAAIREALKAAGVPEEDINTNYINIYVMYDYLSEQEQVTAYEASSTLSIRVRDMKSVGTVIDTAFSAGANTLDGISFSASDQTEAKAESLRMAVADARARAEVMAEAAGLKITGMETISDEGVFSYNSDTRNVFASAKTEDSAAGTVVQAAKIEVSAQVSIVFTAE